MNRCRLKSIFEKGLATTRSIEKINNQPDFVNCSFMPNILHMTPAAIFSLCSSVAMAGWIILIVFPFWKQSDKFIIGIIITLFAIVYAWLLFSTFSLSDFQKFGSLQGVMELFTNPAAVTAGWVHYLAFDLLTGIFIKKNAVKHNISHWWLIPCLFLTFMAGPVGLLLYLIIRTIITKNYFAANY